MTADLRRRLRRAVLSLITVAPLLAALAVAPGHAQAGNAGEDTSPVVPITPQAGDTGRVFDGLGAISGGGNTSRLLQDYPAAQRRQILDYLFRPHFGASLQMLKVEIGADTDATEGAEPSVERDPGQVDCSRDASWSIMRAARARNPRITLVGLEWGAPGWLRGGFWSQDNIDYLLSWLGCARAQGLTVDYVGGWNERGYRAGWYTALAAALARSYPQTKVIAADSFGWSVAAAMRADAAFARAVTVVGVHHPCTPEWRVASCPSSVEARALPQPLWASEQSAQDFTGGAEPLARELNLNYVDGQMTGAFVWSAVSAFYDDLPLAGRGLMLAEQPWSGAYSVGLDVWVMAHTTQFAAPGWRYLDHASGRLPLGGSYVTLRAPGGGRAGADWSSVVETTLAGGPQSLRYQPGPGLRGGRLHVWCSDLASADPARWFQRRPDLVLGRAGGTVTMPPDTLCSLTTTTGQHRGTSSPPQPRQLSLPFTASVAGPLGSSPPLFFDVNGAFETAPCAGGRVGTCLQQMTTRQPIAWMPAGKGPPTTLVGDPAWWGDYTVSASALLQRAPWVELLGRVEAASGSAVDGYALRLAAGGGWQLIEESVARPAARHDTGQGTPLDRVLTSGHVALPPGWQHLALQMTGPRLTAVVDGVRLATVVDAAHSEGQVGFRVGGWATAQFADLTVQPTAAAPNFRAGAGLTVTASSQRYERGYNIDYRAARVLDGRPATLWESDGPATAEQPQWLTVTLPAAQRVQALAVTPRRDGLTTGLITGWRVEVSPDGRTFTPVAQGTWPASSATHLVAWPEAVAARAVRLVITGSVGSCAAVAELRLVVAAQPRGGQRH